MVLMLQYSRGLSLKMPSQVRGTVGSMTESEPELCSLEQQSSVGESSV
ncbi:hypothetical protein A2U01_0107696, partial [Trifolium medium]|nr:hypothetical protein [Trifolium medium]